MPPRTLRSRCLIACTLLAGSAVIAAPPAPLSAFLDKHCAECHDADVKKGDLDISALSFDLSKPASGSFKAWQRIFERVQKGDMPPAKSPRPDHAESQQFLVGLKQPLIQADAADVAALGRVHSRRLTRTEYEYTMHDLLGIDIPLKDLLPEDRSSNGFETVADGQQLSYHQLGRYLDVADQALDEAFKRGIKGDTPWSHDWNPKEMANKERGNYRGPDLHNGKSISWPINLQFTGKLTATRVPEDGWYRIILRGVHAINPVNGTVWGTLRSGECASSAPMLYMIGTVEATATPRDLVFQAWMQEGHMLELKPNDATLKRAPNGAGGGNVSFVGRDLEKEGYSGIASVGVSMERIHPGSALATLQHYLFGEAGLKAAQADPALSLDLLVAAFARRAFRRPLTDEQVAPYREMGRQALAAGEPFLEALRTSYRSVLCSPRFLTFVESPRELDDHAVASRLSYAFWASMPDAALFKLAESGGLRSGDNLRREVDRMLADPKAARFIRSFTDQWLKLKEIDFTNPDTRQFPTFDAVVQQSMLQETQAYFAALLKDDLSVSHLVDSDFTFMNGRLASFYKADVPVTPGGGLQKVSLIKPEQRIRGGFIGQGAVLKVTADGTATSPVVRGVFVNERILGESIAPPPPGIPAIEPDIRGATTIRDQLDKHRNNASCAACHKTIDPPGFALENFDPVGIWRETYPRRNEQKLKNKFKGKKVPLGPEVNPTGVTPEGQAFADLAAWKQIYTQRSAQLAHGFVHQFITYATGAPPRFSDLDAVQKVVNDTEGSSHGLRSLIQAVVASPAFLYK